jgi:hypothetical protein
VLLLKGLLQWAESPQRRNKNAQTCTGGRRGQRPCRSRPFALAGCAAAVTAAGGRTVVVRAGVPDMGIERALTLAEAECRKQGLSDRVQSVTTPNSDRYIFECVSRA